MTAVVLHHRESDSHRVGLGELLRQTMTATDLHHRESDSHRVGLGE